MNLNWQEHTKINPSLLRKGDSKIIVSDPSRLKNELGWLPRLNIENLLDRCLESQLKSR